MKKKVLFVLTAVILIAGFYAITYLPKRIITIEPTKVSKIEIFDGNRGELITVTDNEQKEHIVSNLNRIHFGKGKLGIGYMGYKFRTVIYDVSGKAYKEITINNSEKVRYGGFFYTRGSGEKIDVAYIDSLFEANGRR